MKLLKEIYFGEKPGDTKNWQYRKASRAVVLDRENNIAIVYVSTYEYPKLPGGGVEGNEELEQTLRRECLEEIGCEIEIIGEIGEVIEYRAELPMLQDAYCFLAKVKGEKGPTNFTKNEIELGIKVEWLPINEALKMFDKEPSGYLPKFIKQRELVFLNEAKRQLYTK